MMEKLRASASSTRKSLFFGVFLTSPLLCVVSQKSFKTSLFTLFLSLSFWTLSSYLTQRAFCNNTNNNKSTKERERERERERVRDDGFFFFFFFFFVLSCARLSSRTTTLQFGFIGVEEKEDSIAGSTFLMAAGVVVIRTTRVTKKERRTTRQKTTAETVVVLVVFPTSTTTGKGTLPWTTSSSSSSGGSSSEKLSSSSSGEQDIYNRSRDNGNGGGGGGGGGFGFSKTLNDLALKAKDVFAPDATSSAPPSRRKDSTMDPLEAILAWHLGSSTSTTLTSQEVSDTIVNEVTSFPANKLVRGQSPSVAMHLPHSIYSSAREKVSREERAGYGEEIGHGERDDEW